MTEEELCGGKTFKEVMQEVDFHISDKQRIAKLEKEIEQWKQEWQDAQIKANEEGFARTTLQIKYSELEKENEELKKQIDQLSNDNHVLKTSFITQQEQIEKMKNVGNCKHSMNCAKWNEKQTILGLMKFCLNCKDWELAE